MKFMFVNNRKYTLYLLRKYIFYRLTEHIKALLIVCINTASVNSIDISLSNTIVCYTLEFPDPSVVTGVFFLAKTLRRASLFIQPTSRGQAVEMYSLGAPLVHWCMIGHGMSYRD